MILIGASLSLLVIYAGVKLLIQCKKEILGNSFKYAAWFFILSGFLILAGAGACCIAKCCKYGARMMMHKEHKKNGYMGGDYEEMDHHMMHKHMMYDHHRGEESCMRHANCCGNAENAKCGNSSSCMKDSACKK